MANSNFDQQIRARIQNFTEELALLVRESALESLREALGEPTKRGPGRPRGSGRLAKRAAKAPGRQGRAAARAKGAKRAPDELERLTTQLHQYIKANPGQRIEQVAAAMGTPTKELNLPVRKLIANKQLRTKGQKRATQYYAK
jgi:hypothetical protein